MADRLFLERVFQKLLLNFTWWVNRKDAEGNNVFQGGFLGLDNIGVFDRSAPLPGGGHLEQSDGTVLDGHVLPEHAGHRAGAGQDNPAYEDVASKFFEHFVYIAKAMNELGDGITLWDEEDGFYYDVLHMPDDARQLKVRSMVGLIPLFAVETLEPDVLDRLPGFKRRMQWFIDNRPEFRGHVTTAVGPGGGVRRLLSIVRRPQLVRVLALHAGRDEFLSPYGIRALSRYHREHPYVLTVDGVEHRVDYEPAESTTGLFGGNSNWRGPIWFPVNYLLIESLQKFHHFYGDDLKVECPTGSSRLLNLWEVAAELSRGLTHLFLRGRDGRRPVYGVDRAVPARSALARPHPLPRVLPRRQGRRHRRQPPDGLDRTGGQAHRAERRMTTLAEHLAERRGRRRHRGRRAGHRGGRGRRPHRRRARPRRADRPARDDRRASTSRARRSRSSTCGPTTWSSRRWTPPAGRARWCRRRWRRSATAPSAARAPASSCASIRWTAPRTSTSTASSERSSPS